MIKIFVFYSNPFPLSYIIEIHGATKVEKFRWLYSSLTCTNDYWCWTVGGYISLSKNKTSWLSIVLYMVASMLPYSSAEHHD